MPPGYDSSAVKTPRQTGIVPSGASQTLPQQQASKAMPLTHAGTQHNAKEQVPQPQDDTGNTLHRTHATVHLHQTLASIGGNHGGMAKPSLLGKTDD